ncbi:hypothetical protein [Pseudomonas sp. M30-35]|uniref:hypothetical protein n=1 Tax=Pseudomonas sp. M30-35 TaxID=1981174 RepID=UPI000B3C1AA1|nr:hypothetical protein [Pseudomonas sp. M30-35]ARU86554.1 hypothetical protein B9K09_00440 [Pseudomonas sp. M30-35]
MNPSITMPDTTPRSRVTGRLQLLLILAIVIGPMVLATAMFYGNFWVPESRNYHGELLGTGENLENLGVNGAEDKRWQLLVTAPNACTEDCKKLVFLARQINIGLNRDATRATHTLATSQPVSSDYDHQLKREYPQLAQHSLELSRYQKTLQLTGAKAEEAQLWIVDPHGNLVLRYDSNNNGKETLKDLQHLLKLSRIG